MSHVATHQKDQPSLIIVFACRLMQIFFRHFPLSYDRWSVTDQLVVEKYRRKAPYLRIQTCRPCMYCTNDVFPTLIALSTRRSCFNQWCAPCGAAHIMKKRAVIYPKMEAIMILPILDVTFEVVLLNFFQFVATALHHA